MTDINFDVDKQFQIYSITPPMIHHLRFRFLPVSVRGRGGMPPYQNAITEEKLLSSKNEKESFRQSLAVR